MSVLAVEYEPEPHPHDIPRLGESAEFRSLLLRLVELSGWTVEERPAFGGGVLVIAHRPGLPVIARRGETAADVAVPIFTEAMSQRAAL